MTLTRLRSLFDLNDFISNQAMGFAMNGDRSLFIGRFNQAKDLAARLVEPVAQVLDSVFVLCLQVGFVSLGYRLCGEPLDMAVRIHKQWHGFLLTMGARTAASALSSLNTPFVPAAVCRIVGRGYSVYLPHGRFAGRFVSVRRAAILIPERGGSPGSGWRPLA